MFREIRKKHRNVRKQYITGCEHFIGLVPEIHHNKLRSREAMKVGLKLAQRRGDSTLVILFLNDVYEL